MKRKTIESTSGSLLRVKKIVLFDVCTFINNKITTAKSSELCDQNGLYKPLKYCRNKDALEHKMKTFKI